MAIIFLEKRKRLQYLFPVLGIVILITLIVLWRGFFTKIPLEIIQFEIPKPVKKIEINFEILKNPQLEELQLLEKIPPYDGEIGRENPFIPY